MTRRSRCAIACLLSSVLWMSARSEAVSPIGPDDFPISNDPESDLPAVAYNSQGQEFLIVWQALVTGGVEIFGQRIDAQTGLEVGPDDFQISSTGASGDAREPAVAYDSDHNRYLVVWTADDPDFAGLASNADEAIGVLVAADGTVTSAEVRFSFMNDPGEDAHRAREVDVVHAPGADRFLVARAADFDQGGQIDNEIEVFTRVVTTDLVAATGQQRISSSGGLGDTNGSARQPALAYDPLHDFFVATWVGLDETTGMKEIFGQLLEHVPVGSSSILIERGGEAQLSGPDPDGVQSESPDVAYDGIHQEFLVAWAGDGDSSGRVAGEEEIFGQRVGYDGSLLLLEVGADDFPVSDLHGVGVPGLSEVDRPAIAFDSELQQFLVVWESDDDVSGIADDEVEIFGQLLQAGTGEEIGDNDFRLSNMGADLDPESFASVPAVAFSEDLGTYLAVWAGSEDQGETQLVFGQGLSTSGPIFTDGFESGDTSAWSLVSGD